MNTLKSKFKVIALSETWIDKDRGIDFCIDGYELYHSSRRNKKGGGVALFVNSDLNCRPVECMTLVIDDLFECVTVEVDMEKKRNIIVTCVYRTLGSKVETFNESLEDLLCKVKEKKTFTMCGDFNIDLLSSPRNTSTRDFLDVVYSRGLYPLITKPSKITTSCATLIDHIFINAIENIIDSGLLVNDISDHLPVFLTYDSQMHRKREEIDYRYVRKRMEKVINKLRKDLFEADWNEVYV